MFLQLWSSSLLLKLLKLTFQLFAAIPRKNVLHAHISFQTNTNPSIILLTRPLPLAPPPPPKFPEVAQDPMPTTSAFDVYDSAKTRRDTVTLTEFESVRKKSRKSVDAVAYERSNFLTRRKAIRNKVCG